MTKKALIIAAVAATLGSGTAFAQTYDRDYRNDNRYEQQDRSYRVERYDSDRRDGWDRRDRWDRYDRRDYHGYNNYNHYNNYNNYNNYRVYEHRNYGYNHGYRYGVRRGEYLDRRYYGRRYLVSDWRGRRLYAPPHGYHWVQAGNDYLLVALATGLIANVILNH